MIDFDRVEETNLRSDDRVFILAPIDGKKAKNGAGLVDPRLFSGDNKLHAIHDVRVRLWSLRYEVGGLPEPLKQKWTKFSQLKEDVIKYFAKRNVQVVKIIE